MMLLPALLLPKKPDGNLKCKHAHKPLHAFGNININTYRKVEYDTYDFFLYKNLFDCLNIIWLQQQTGWSLCFAQVRRPDSCASAKVSVSTEDEQTVSCMSDALYTSRIRCYRDLFLMQCVQISHCCANSQENDHAGTCYFHPSCTAGVQAKKCSKAQNYITILDFADSSQQANNTYALGTNSFV